MTIVGIFLFFLFLGKPGSGKTSLLKFLIKSSKFFFKKFDYIFVLCPSFKEYEILFLPIKNYFKILDWKWYTSY